MPTNPIIPTTPDSSQPGNVPPVIGAPPATGFKHQRGSWENLLAIVLNVYLVVFMTDAVLSLADDSLLLFFNLHLLTLFRTLVGFAALMYAVIIYLLMALTPMVPKRIFLPLTLFNLVGMLAIIPFLIYHYGQVQLIVWSVSVCQVVFGVVMLCCLQGRFKVRWPLMTFSQLNLRRFSWLNLSGFVLANLFVLLPLVIAYLAFNASLAVNHFSEGFVALRPGGITVQVRKYVRSDGKMIELFPMSHIADAGFYQKVSQTFPTNSIILMEGVTDNQNLLTNEISYKRMARSLGLSEQQKAFMPDRGKMVRADIDIDQFSKETIGFLNLVMLFHAKGLNPGVLQKLMLASTPPHFEDRLFDDLLNKRNQHLLEEIQIRLAQADNLMVPWGAAHMPGIAKGIEKDGFHLQTAQDYMTIKFRLFGNSRKTATPPDNEPKTK